MRIARLAAIIVIIAFCLNMSSRGTGDEIAYLLAEDFANERLTEGAWDARLNSTARIREAGK